MILITLFFCQPNERLVYLFPLDEPRSRSATLTADKIPYQRTRGRPRTSSIHDLLEQQIRASHVSLPAIHAPKYSRGTYRGEPGWKFTEGAPSRGFLQRWTESKVPQRVHQKKTGVHPKVKQVRSSTKSAPSLGFHWGWGSTNYSLGRQCTWG